MTTPRPRLLAALSRELNRALERFPNSANGIPAFFGEPHKLKGSVATMETMFDQGAPPEPPTLQRRQALARLRAGAINLTRRDWNLVAWGLCDEFEPGRQAIDDVVLFEAVVAHTGGWLQRREVPRSGWFGLLNSYLSFDIDARPDHGNWHRLRGRLQESMPILIASVRHPKLWSRMLEEHGSIVTEDAGRSLRHAMFSDTPANRQQIAETLSIPEASWLWRRVVEYQIAYLPGMRDEDFQAAVPSMMDFVGECPIFGDHLLAAMLTRYCKSAHRDTAHDLLKNASFSRWGNPQLKSASRWSIVEEPVKAMVLRWFAKEDLEHFFSLLQGDGQADQARLEYWLRFVDQMSYTRILLGGDALTSQHSEFRNFRRKNESRCGQLVGGPSHNNAFIMEINDHWFVEFSGTGNACYAYSKQQLPFEPSAGVLHSATDLKVRIPRGYDDNRILHMNGWQWKADAFLARCGIHPGRGFSRSTATINDYRPRLRPAAPLAAPPRNEPADRALRPETTDPGPVVSQPMDSAALAGIVQRAGELARTHMAQVQDNLKEGDAFRILAFKADSVLGLELSRLGMHFDPAKGFWIK